MSVVAMALNSSARAEGCTLNSGPHLLQRGLGGGLVALDHDRRIGLAACRRLLQVGRSELHQQVGDLGEGVYAPAEPLCVDQLERHLAVADEAQVVLARDRPAGAIEFVLREAAQSER